MQFFLSLRASRFLLVFALSDSRAEINYPVNVFIGTGGNPTTGGMTFPGATLPFGMVRLSPDTRYAPGPMSWMLKKNQFAASAGYAYDRTRILGFSHTRYSGTGRKEGGFLRVTPKKFKDSSKPDFGDVPFRHSEEKATPGYYSLQLPTEKVFVELTSTTHCGVHRYSLTDPRGAMELMIDVTSNLAFGKTAGQVSIDSKARSFQGTAAQMGKKNLEIQTHFYAEYSREIESARFFEDSRWVPLSGATPSGTKIGVSLFNIKQPQVEVRVCLSPISIQNAKQNFESELGAKSFQQIANEASSAWNKILSRVQVSASISDVPAIFYSALYRSFLLPTHFTDTNGQYKDSLGKVQTVPAGVTYRTDFSLWDTFRTVHPLFTLVAPEIQKDSLFSLLEVGKNQGVLPRFVWQGHATTGMLGNSANFLFSESYLKGLRDLDFQSALDLMVWQGSGFLGEQEILSREEPCFQFGYCPADLVKESVSKTLDYAWADWATAQLAGALGKEEIRKIFAAKSQAFRNLWEPESRYFGPKNSDGRFIPFSKTLPHSLGFLGRSSKEFTEGSAAQWRYSVPHAPQDLVALFGGPEEFVVELENFMKGASRKMNPFLKSGRYYHGNEPDFHAAYLFAEAGRPDLTQKWVRWILKTRYANRPGGLDGNDDAGTLSAWYVFSALGFYPQAGSDRYWLGSPIIDEAVLNLGNQKTLKITTENQSEENDYVSSVFLNGKPMTRASVSHAELMNAELKFVMSRIPTALKN